MKKTVLLIIVLIIININAYAQFKNLHTFNDTTGEVPDGTLTYYNGILYGMTAGGGPAGNGVIFSINTDGTGYQELFYFDGQQEAYRRVH